jgi:mannose-6-phosphate isomerase-like protein (cupin superfamily)
MNENGFVPGWAQRCLFRNEDVEAHLLAVPMDQAKTEMCFSCRATLLVTFGRACLWLGGQLMELATGQQCEIPAKCPILMLGGEVADVMLLLKRSADDH